jgi:heat-inducible transcriptional repressor
MEEKELPIREEVAVKERLWDTRFRFDKLLREMTRSLAEQTGSLALATTHEGDIFYSGAGQVLDMPEFYDIDTTKTVLSMLDHSDDLMNLFNRAVGEDPIKVLMGEDMGVQYLEPIGFVFTHYDAGKNHTGVVGIVGPNRMAYQTVIPTLRYYGGLLGEMSHSW